MKHTKNIFGIEASKTTKETKFDGTAFIARRINKDHEDAIKEALAYGKEQHKRASSPLYFRVIRYASWGIVIYLLITLLQADMGIGEAIKATPGNVFLMFAFAFVAIVIQFYETSRMKQMVNTEQYQAFKEKVDGLVRTSMEQLRIPEDATSIDVFTFTYRLDEEGNRVINTNKFFRFISKEVYVFVQDGKLCLSDIYETYEIPLDSIKEMHQHHGKASVGNWNKREDIKSERFKPFNIKSNKYGTYYMNGYYSLAIKGRKEDFELLFPPYERDEIMRLTKLSVVDAIEKDVTEEE